MRSPGCSPTPAYHHRAVDQPVCRRPGPGHARHGETGLRLGSSWTPREMTRVGALTLKARAGGLTQLHPESATPRAADPPDLSSAPDSPDTAALRYRDAGGGPGGGGSGTGGRANRPHCSSGRAAVSTIAVGIGLVVFSPRAATRAERIRQLRAAGCLHDYTTSGDGPLRPRKEWSEDPPAADQRPGSKGDDPWHPGGSPRLLRSTRIHFKAPRSGGHHRHPDLTTRLGRRQRRQRQNGGP